MKEINVCIFKYFKERVHLENVGVNGRIILETNRVGRCKLGMKQWWASVNTTINLRVT
jgi:hypothetical protein